MRKVMTKTMPVAITYNDIVKTEFVEMGSVFQHFHARCLDFEEMGWLDRAWLGGHFTDRVVMELIYRITYNRLHVDSKFEFDQMDVTEFIASVNPRYIHGGDRSNHPDQENLKRSMAFDDLISDIERLVDQKLADTDLVWHWWEPMMTITRRTMLEISMYDYRAYSYMLDRLAKEQANDDDEVDD